MRLCEEVFPDKYSVLTSKGYSEEEIESIIRSYEAGSGGCCLAAARQKGRKCRQ